MMLSEVILDAINNASTMTDEDAMMLAAKHRITYLLGELMTLDYRSYRDFEEAETKAFQIYMAAKAALEPARRECWNEKAANDMAVGMN